jgi:23S rRNA pseudouridine1911/1915/1917 synthase
MMSPRVAGGSFLSVIPVLPWLTSSRIAVEKLFDIVHEDADLLVINKPADLVCHPTKGDVYSSLISRVRLYLGLPGGDASPADAKPKRRPRRSRREAAEAAQPEALRIHFVNRLDRETSGLVMLAKNDRTALELRRIWESRTVRKEYAAIVHGHVTAERGTIDAPLGKDVHSIVAVKDCVRADGLLSQTDYEVARRLERAEGRFTLLRVWPHTGRKHQIRIHLAHLGHPIVGDKLYGGDEDLYMALVEERLTGEQRGRLMLPCQALHAGAVRFQWRGMETTFRAPPEKWFVDFAQGGWE